MVRVSVDKRCSMFIVSHFRNFRGGILPLPEFWFLLSFFFIIIIMPPKHSLQDSEPPMTPKKRGKKLSQRRLEMLRAKNQGQNKDLENSDRTMSNISDLRMEKDKGALLLWVYHLSPFLFVLHHWYLYIGGCIYRMWGKDICRDAGIGWSWSIHHPRKWRTWSWRHLFRQWDHQIQSQPSCLKMSNCLSFPKIHWTQYSYQL